MLKLEKPNTEKLTVKTKEVFQKIGKRNFVIILSVLVIGCAVWLNIALFSQGSKQASAGLNSDDTADVQNSPTFVEGNNDDNNTSIDGFFASTQVERQRSRDEALEVLQLVAESPDALEESKSAALAEISQIALDIDNESKIESLVTAKGIEKCVAVINSSKCNVVVKTAESLLPNQIAQIQEIVYEQSGILPSNVKIIEKTGV